VPERGAVANPVHALSVSVALNIAGTALFNCLG